MNLNKHITKTLLNEYAGSEKKKTVLMDDGNKYLLKFPDPIREKGRDLSYINNAISEHISCSIYNIIGIPAQKTIIGEYIDEKGNTKIACACQDVRGNGETMYEINKLELSSLDNTTFSLLISIKHLGTYAASELFKSSSAKLTPTRPAPIIATLIFCTSFSFPASIPENTCNNIERIFPLVVSWFPHLYA